MKNVMGALSLDLLFVVALPVEARFLIDHYRLKKRHEISAFAYYVSKECRVALVISGVGKVNAAMATAWAAGQYAKVGALLNIGIAGGYQHSLGSVWLANKVIDQDTNYAVYPTMTQHYPLPSTTVLTVSQPVVAPDNHLVDMESAGFLQAAGRFCSSEQAHCLKVISDNIEQSHHQIDGKHVKALMENALPCVVKVADQLQQVQDLVPQVSEQVLIGLTNIAQQYAISHYQQNQLRALLVQLYAQHNSADYLLEQALKQATTLANLLSLLQKKLAQEALKL